MNKVFGEKLSRTPWPLVAIAAGTLFLLHTLLRILLFAVFSKGSIGLGSTLELFGIGLVVDFFVVLVACLPLVFWLAIIPHRIARSGLHRFAWSAGMIFLWTLGLFFILAEFFFFDEFHSRFNTVAVDYLLYPHEVFINIWETYPVGWVIAFALLFGIGWVAIVRWQFPKAWEERSALKLRLGIPLLFIAPILVLWPVVGNHLTRFSNKRVLNELANNGWYTFAQAAVTREFEYAPFYITTNLDQAYKTTRELLAQPNSKYLQDGHSITRMVAGDSTKPKLNVVVLLEESLGSEFFGCLGRTAPTCTPELDKLSHEAMLLTNLYASGNRTVRGMEAVICSFPPLPGDSVVVRSGDKPIETLARVLKRDGYKNTFIYAGRGVFDHVRSFMTDNGYDHFIEQSDFENPVFSTIWGVSNEDLYSRGIEECRKADQSGQPFLLTMLSVSNHKPFTYPKGRIPEDPELRTRENAVKYTDYAIGKFFEQAKQERFWTNTIFVVVADHGARVYGQQTIPMKSYEIPCFIFGPAVVKTPARIGNLAGQVDISPTILGLIGRPYISSFFGRDIFQVPPSSGRTFLNHNRDIGLFESNQMVVLGLNKTADGFIGDSKAGELKEIEDSNALAKTKSDAVSLFQVANDLYLRNACAVSEADIAEAQARSSLSFK